MMIYFLKGMLIGIIFDVSVGAVGRMKIGRASCRERV